MTENRSIRTLAAENPGLVLLLGACPALGATADVRSALGMGCVLVAVMLISTLIVCLLKQFIPEKVKIPAVLLIVAGVVSVADLLTHALFPSVYQLLGIYVSVLAVNLLLFAGAEGGCSLRIDKAIGQSLMMGLLLAVVLLFVAAVREVLGAASFAGVEIEAMKDYRIPLLTQSAGGFLVLALAAAVLNLTSGSRPASELAAQWAGELTETEQDEKTEEVEAK